MMTLESKGTWESKASILLGGPGDDFECGMNVLSLVAMMKAQGDRARMKFTKSALVMFSDDEDGSTISFSMSTKD